MLYFLIVFMTKETIYLKNLLPAFKMYKYFELLVIFLNLTVTKESFSVTL